MDKLKQWVALTVVGVLAVLAAGWFLLVSPKRATAGDLAAQTTTQEATNGGLRTQLAMLKAQAKDEPAQEAKLARVAAKIPDNPALPALIRDLDKASAATGVDVTSLAPSPPALVAAPITRAVPLSAASSTAAATGKSPTISTAGAASAPTAAGGALAAIPVSLSVTGTYFQILEFVDQLEGLNRAFKVSSLAVTPGAATGSAGAPTATPSNLVTAAVTGTVYMAAGRTPLAAVTIPKPGK